VLTPPVSPVVQPVVAQQPIGGEPQPKPKRRTWVWAVVGGAAAAVAIGLGVGLGVGLSAHDPAVTLGSVRGN
jgi:hypothetical protein